MSHVRHVRRRGGPWIAAALALISACTALPQPEAAPIIRAFTVTAPDDLTAPALVPVSWTVRDANNDTLTCRLDYTSDGTWDETIRPCPSTGGRNFAVGAGSGTVTFDVSDAKHPRVSKSAGFAVAPGPSESYDIVVDQHSTDPRVTDAVAEAVARWSSVIASGVPDAQVTAAPGSCTAELPGYEGHVDDIVIQVVVLDDLGGVMGDAAPCIGGPDGLPRLSIVRLHAHAIDLMSESGYLGDLLTHEFGHALGFSGAAWGAFHDYSNFDDRRFTGPRAMAEWSRLGGTASVPLSNVGDHWDETLLQNEIMTCYIENLVVHPLSALTVAAMADIGYHVNLANAEPWQRPTEPGLMSC